MSCVGRLTDFMLLSRVPQVLPVYFGDRWNAAVDPSGPSHASYVWLPLVPADSTTQTDDLQLLNLNSWRLGDYRMPLRHGKHMPSTAAAQ